MQPLDEAHDQGVRVPHADAGAEPLDVRRLVDGLPEAQRRVITLFYLEDRSLREVGLMLDMPEGTVKSHLHRAGGRWLAR